MNQPVEKYRTDDDVKIDMVISSLFGSDFLIKVLYENGDSEVLIPKKEGDTLTVVSSAKEPCKSSEAYLLNTQGDLLERFNFDSVVLGNGDTLTVSIRVKGLL